MYLQHRLVMEVRSRGSQVNAGTVARATGIAAKTSQRHLAGTQLLGLNELLLWHTALPVDLVAALPRAPSDLVPPPYRRRLQLKQFGEGVPPRFSPPTGDLDLELLAERALARVIPLVSSHAEHLLTDAALAGDVAFALVEQGVQAGLVGIAPDEPATVQVAYRQPTALTVVASLDRQAASSAPRRLLSALLRADGHVLCLLGPEALAHLQEAVPQLTAATEGRGGTVRLQDMRAAGLPVEVQGVADLDVLIASCRVQGPHLCLVLHPMSS